MIAAGIGYRIAAVFGHHVDDDAADADGVGDRRAGHAGEDHVRDDVDVAEAAAEATDQHEAEAQQTVGQPADVHQVGGEDEQRNREQDVAVEQAVEDLLGGGAEVETRQAADRGSSRRSSNGRSAGRATPSSNDRDDAERERADGIVIRRSWAGSVSGGFAPWIAR